MGAIFPFSQPTVRLASQLQTVGGAFWLVSRAHLSAISGL